MEDDTMTDRPARRRIVILGAAGRDFHNFQCCYRDDPSLEVVAFTATQIPAIAGRRYPASLAGALYPQGIPIHAETELGTLIAMHHVEEVVFAYSDVSNQTLMTMAQMVLASGANFRLLGAYDTMLSSRLPVVAVCAVRTGCGKSAVTRRVVQLLRQRGVRPVVLRHPMPYGDLEAQRLQRFATFDDLERQHCTIEEREEYEPHLEQGTVVYAGVDYAAILHMAEEEAEVIVWDGGNNDLPFLRPDLHLCLVDPHRPGHETLYYPGLANLLMADVVVVAKEDTADPTHIEQVKGSVRRYNPRATVIDAASPLRVNEPQWISGKRVLVVEDGPTLTHGNMTYGAGLIAAERFGAAEIVDPGPYAQGAIAETLRAYPGLRRVLPAIGYGEQHMAELAATINAVPCDTVVFGTPVDLRRLLTLRQPAVRVRYEVQEIGRPTLADVLPNPLVKKTPTA
jgi:predicted GTPase